MTKKRIGSFLLCLAMLVSALPRVTPAARATAPTKTVAPTLTYATDEKAFIKDVKLSQSGAWNLKIDANATGSGNAYAIIMSYANFQASYAGDSQIGNISSSNFDKLPGATATAFYRTKMSTVSPGTVTLLDANLKSGTNAPFTVGETSTTYHAHYALIIFDGGTTVEDLSDYTIGDFYVDSEGKLQTESYMLRYIKNSGSVGTTVGVNAMPAYQIEGWGTSAQVAATATASNPTRSGYTFYGWDHNGGKMPTVPNDAAVANPKVDFPRDTDSKTLAWATVGGGTHNKDKDLIYDLYAIWKPVMVGVEAVSKSADAAAEQTTKAKVGVAFEWKYNAKGSYSAANPREHGGNTTKTVSARYSTGNGATFQDGLPAGMGLATTKQDKVMTYKALDVTPSGETEAAAFCITGRPTEFTSEPITIRLKVTDKSNKTWVEQDLLLTEIEKGSQSVIPDEDVSTGLETDVVEAATPPDEGGGEVTEPAAEDTPDAPAKDGQILGFYSLGQKLPEEQGGHPNADGSGSLRKYYLDVDTPGMWNEALIYEYKPDTVEDKPENWREVPLPESYYGKLTADTTLTKAQVEDAMKAGAASKISSTLARGANGAVKLTDATPVTPEGGTAWAGWTSEYGYVDWDGNGCPVVHGLTEGAKYNVRFKANADYDASAPVTLTITKGGGGSSGGDSGPADPSDFVTVVCFDWDNTLLGSVTVPKEASEEDVLPYIREFEKSLMSPESKDYDDTKTAYFVDDEKYPLTYKAGYSFSKWLYNQSDKPTHWGRSVNGLNVISNIEEPLNPEDVASFSNLENNITVKACYTDNIELIFTPDIPANMRYQIDTIDTVRLGTSANYSITVKVQRKDVMRLVEPVLLVTLYTSSGSVFSFNTLSNSDVSEFTFYPTSALQRAEYKIVDFYGISDKSAANAKSETKTEYKGTSAAMDGYLWAGTVAMINDAVAENQTANLNLKILFAEANLMQPSGGLNLSNILNDLRKAWILKNSSDGTDDTLFPKAQQVRLTYDEMNYAISHEGMMPAVEKSLKNNIRST